MAEWLRHWFAKPKLYVSWVQFPFFPVNFIQYMVTCKQLQRKSRVKKLKTNRKRALQANPQKKAHCIRVYKVAPKKPNSARRSVARVGLSNSFNVTAYIPGEGHNLQKYSCVLLRGGRVPDLPGVFYKIVRGKFDCHSVVKRRKSRSLYGAKK